MRKNTPLLIQPYRGYANPERFFLMGRVMRDRGINNEPMRRLHTFRETFRRFHSDEKRSMVVEMELGENHFIAITDREGYFKIDSTWQALPEPPVNSWFTAKLRLKNRDEEATANIYYPSKNASFGILSDVDDTVLQTDMTSWLKLRMLYNTFFKNAKQRLPMEGMPNLLNTLIKGGDGQRENPVFYVSDSPWNIYDILVDFMRLQKLPKGPLMLRDYGRQIIFNRRSFDSHKIRAISHILETYPGLPFIMLGDTASHDADHYLHFAKKYQGRILAIYIRLTKDTSNAQRVARLIEQNTNTDAVLIRSSKEILAHAQEKGFMK